MTKRKVQFANEEQIEEGRPAPKSSRFKVEPHCEDHYGRWVEVTPHAILPDFFDCGKCAKVFSARSSIMRHQHWCVFEDTRNENHTHTHNKIHHRHTHNENHSGNTSSEIVRNNNEEEANTSAEHTLIMCDDSTECPTLIVCNSESPPNEIQQLHEEVKDVVTELVGSVAVAKLERKLTRGADNRKKYTNLEKVEIITEVLAGARAVEVAQRHSIHRSLITKWMQKKELLINAVSASPKKSQDTKNRQKTCYEKLYIELYDKYLAAQKEGVEISQKWLYSSAEKLYKESFSPEGNRILPQSFITNFRKRYNIPKIVKVKNENNESHNKLMVRWHSTSRQKPDNNDSSSNELVPLSFAIDLKSSFEDVRGKEDNPGDVQFGMSV